MRDNTGKVTGDSLPALHWDQGACAELKNLILESGIQNLDPEDLTQVLQALNILFSKRDCSNTVINSQSKVSDNHCGNTIFGVGSTNPSFWQTQADNAWPIESIYYSATSSNINWKLPYTNIPGVNITWELQDTEGRLIVGASATGHWQVNGGESAGNSQTADPMGIENLLRHEHFLRHDEKPVAMYSGDGTTANTLPIQGFPGALPESTYKTSQPTGQDNPTGIGLTDLKRYGVFVWKRTA